MCDVLVGGHVLIGAHHESFIGETLQLGGCVMRGEWASAEICLDCAMWHANGDTSGIDDAEREAVVRAVSGLWVVGEPSGFAFHRCESCHDYRGGDRFHAETLIAYR